MGIDVYMARRIVELALAEDIGSGDLTTEGVLRGEEGVVGRGSFVVKDSGIIAGLDVAGLVFEVLDGSSRLTKFVDDGAKVSKGDVIAEIEAPTGAILRGERVALNLLQRLSGIATKTARYLELVKPYGVKLVDTRKTTPGLRVLEKYAVRVGGGTNHRFGLFDGVLIKDNHIRCVGSVTEAVRRVRARAPFVTRIEVEVNTLEQVREAALAGADIIMLDNMPPDLMKEAVREIAGRALVEASGGITEANIKEVAQTGVDVISVGELTYNARPLDISLEL